jgi:hypothetical protein
MDSHDQVPLEQLEPLLLRAELLLEQAVNRQQLQSDQRHREHTWIELELNRCALPLQQLSRELAGLMEQMGVQRQDTLIQHWQADLQQALRQLEAITLHVEELQASLANDTVPRLEAPLVETPPRQLQDLLTRRQRQMAVLHAELLELRSQLAEGAETVDEDPDQNATAIPSLFDDQS